LDFGGKAKMSSIKNFILENPFDPSVTFIAI
jgi:hypothetical protein